MFLWNSLWGTIIFTDICRSAATRAALPFACRLLHSFWYMLRCLIDYHLPHDPKCPSTCGFFCSLLPFPRVLCSLLPIEFFARFFLLAFSWSLFLVQSVSYLVMCVSGYMAVTCVFGKTPVLPFKDPRNHPCCGTIPETVMVS